LLYNRQEVRPVLRHRVRIVLRYNASIAALSTFLLVHLYPKLGHRLAPERVIAKVDAPTPVRMSGVAIHLLSAEIRKNVPGSPMHTSSATVRAEALASVPRVTRPQASLCRIVVGTGRRGGSAPVIRPGARRGEDARWIPPGGLVTVKGFDIPGGMVYVGSFLSGAPGVGWGANTPAPCLIDPSLKVASGRVSTNAEMGYWPSYADITPEHRLAYLNWLSTGKRDTSFPVGYAFLYFYGLERRLLVDDLRPNEEALLVEEVERLRSLYASSHSFGHYSKALLDVIELRRLCGGPSGV
jgi:hypothetical protein